MMCEEVKMLVGEGGGGGGLGGENVICSVTSAKCPPKRLAVCLVFSRCFTSTETVWLIRDGRWVR